MPPQLPVLINRAAGAAAACGDGLEDRIVQAFAPTGRSIALELVDGSDFHAAVRRHASSPVIVVGGGDGTLSMAANAVVGSRTALGILPLGITNRLAHSLGIPLDLGEAATIAATGERQRTDLGRAGTRVFIGDAAIGDASAMKAVRDGSQFPAWLARAIGAWRVLRSVGPRRHRLTIDGEQQSLRTSLLLVETQRRERDAQDFGARELLRDGDFCLSASSVVGRRQALWFALKVLFGLAGTGPSCRQLRSAHSITIEGSGRVELALDGEPATMTLPLQLLTLPSALGVVVPRVKASPQPYLYQIH